MQNLGFILSSKKDNEIILLKGIGVLRRSTMLIAVLRESCELRRSELLNY